MATDEAAAVETGPSPSEIAFTGETTNITLSFAMSLVGMGFCVLGTRRRLLGD